MTTLASPDSISIADQIACVRREIAMRESAYPRWVANEKMKQEKADAEIAAMKAVLKTVHDVDRLRKIEAAARALNEDSEECDSEEYDLEGIGLSYAAIHWRWSDLRDAARPGRAGGVMGAELDIDDAPYCNNCGSDETVR